MATRLTLSSIAKWPTPNYADPVKRAPTLTVVNVFFFSLMTIILALRFYSKAAIKKSLGIDDVLICFTWVYNWLVIRILLANLENVDIHLRCAHRDHHWYGEVWLEQAYVGRAIFLGPAYALLHSDGLGSR